LQLLVLCPHVRTDRGALAREIYHAGVRRGRTNLRRRRPAPRSLPCHDPRPPPAMRHMSARVPRASQCIRLPWTCRCSIKSIDDPVDALSPLVAAESKSIDAVAAVAAILSLATSRPAAAASAMRPLTAHAAPAHLHRRRPPFRAGPHRPRGVHPRNPCHCGSRSGQVCAAADRPRWLSAPEAPTFCQKKS